MSYNKSKNSLSLQVPNSNNNSQSSSKNAEKQGWTVEKEKLLAQIYLEDMGTNNKPERGYRSRVYNKFMEVCPNPRNTWQEQHVMNKLSLIIKQEKYMNPEKVAQIKDRKTTDKNWREIKVIQPSSSRELNKVGESRNLANKNTREEGKKGNSEPMSRGKAGKNSSKNNELEFDDNNSVPEPVLIVDENNPSEEDLINRNEECMDYYNSSFIGPLNYYEDKIRVEFEKAVEKFREIKVTDRPRLTKINTSRKVGLAVATLNTKILPSYILKIKDNDINEVINLLYCAAVAVTKSVNKSVFIIPGNANKSKKPKFIERLEARISKKMSEYAQLKEVINGNKSVKLENKVKIILNNNKVHAGHGDVNNNIIEVADTIKQMIGKLGSRLRRYNKSAKRKGDNLLFSKNEKAFYRGLKGDSASTKIGKKPVKEELEKFWKGVWSKPQIHNVEARWIKEEREKNKNLPEMQHPEITAEEVTRVIAKSHNWKAPGLDNVTNYWIKHLGCTHKIIAKIFNMYMASPATVPKNLTQGVTYLLPKDAKDTQNPSKYRPITCLSTMYKLLTGIVANRIYNHLEEYNVLTEEQKGCRRGAKGSKEQAIIDEAVTGQARYKNRNLFTAYIDYQKAFDSVPHSWILSALKLYKIDPAIIELIRTMMKDWRTTLSVGQDGDMIKTGLIRILTGIFQGDSLSPLLFCIALNPLSRLLRSLKVGYRLDKQDRTKLISHLLFMDDIKLYASSAECLKRLLRVVESFSEDIRMKFGIDKCKMQSMIAGKLTSDFKCQDGQIIESMKNQETYKYLGFVQSKRNEHKKIKQALKVEFLGRVRKICKSRLNGKNLVKAINTYAVSTLTYSFGVVKWNKDELESLRVGINKIMTSNRQHHPHAAVERMTLPRSEGGRGLIDLHVLQQSQINNLREYFRKKTSSSPLHKIVSEIDKKYTPLNLSDDTVVIEKNLKEKAVRDKLITLNNKSLHGRHQSVLAGDIVDRNASNSWLSRAGLFSETEGFVIAIQDEVIPTKNFKKYIMNDPLVRDDRCRLCHGYKENIAHILSGCTKLAGTEYTHRHNQVAKIIHQKLAKKHNLIEETVPYYKYTPKTIIENKSHTLYWDRTMLTDREVKHNRPDIVLIDKVSKVGYIIDIAVPHSSNLKSKISEKIKNYTLLAGEIKTQYKLTKIIHAPIILSATGVIPTQLHRALKTLELKEGTYIELQKAALLCSSRIVRQFMELPEFPQVS